MNIKMLKTSVAGLVLLLSGLANASMIHFEDLGDLGLSVTVENQQGIISSLGPINSGSLRVGNRDGCILYDCDLQIFNAGFGGVEFYNSEGFIIEDSLGNMTHQIINVGIPGFHVWEFISDPRSFSDGISLLGTIVSDGTMQQVSSAPNQQGKDFSIYVTIHEQSDADNQIPTPSTLAIFLLGIVCLASRRLRK